MNHLDNDFLQKELIDDFFSMKNDGQKLCFVLNTAHMSLGSFLGPGLKVFKRFFFLNESGGPISYSISVERGSRPKDEIQDFKISHARNLKQ